jgi:hypothetical protein
MKLGLGLTVLLPKRPMGIVSHFHIHDRPIQWLSIQFSGKAVFNLQVGYRVVQSIGKGQFAYPDHTGSGGHIVRVPNVPGVRVTGEGAAHILRLADFTPISQPEVLAGSGALLNVDFDIYHV